MFFLVSVIYIKKSKEIRAFEFISLFVKGSTIPQIETYVLNKAKPLPLIVMSLCTKTNYPLVLN